MSRTAIPASGANKAVTEHNFYDFRPALFNTGNIWFVDSNGTAGTGLSPGDPKVTLSAAQTAATTNNDDVIYLAAGHAESFTGAAALTLSKSNLRIIGLGNGRKRPTFTWSTSTAAQMIVSGANVTFKNIVFDLTGIDAVVAAISVTGADVAFEDCEFVMQNSTTGAVLGILTAATATRLRVERCRFLGVKTTTGQTVTACIKHEVGEDFVIKDCHFEGKMTQAILNATAILNGLVIGNTAHVYTGTKFLGAHNSSQFWAVNNRICVASGTAPFTGTILNVAGNVYTTEGVGFSGAAVTI